MVDELRLTRRHCAQSSIPSPWILRFLVYFIVLAGCFSTAHGANQKQRLWLAGDNSARPRARAGHGFSSYNGSMFLFGGLSAGKVELLC
jgi:hypothetical protein